MKQWLPLLLKKYCIACIVILCFIEVNAQTHKPITVSITSNCGGYYEYLPEGYSTSTKTYPVIFFIPGNTVLGTGSATDLKKLLNFGVTYYINNNAFPKSFTINNTTQSFIVISPQFKSWPHNSDVKAVIDHILNKGYKINTAQMYVTGYSTGGDATFKYANTGVEASSRLAAIAPGSSFINPYVDSGAVHIAKANLPVWAMHGASDPQAPPRWSENYVTKINSFNPLVKAKVTLLPGLVHTDAWKKMYDPLFKEGGYSLYEWFLLHSRNTGQPQPPPPPANKPPVANAGTDISIILPQNSTTLNGSQSSDPDNEPLTFLWRKISGPASFQFDNTSKSSPLVSALTEGAYLFELKVTDGSSASSLDTVKVTVIKKSLNQKPVANAGDDKIVYLPQDYVVLDGSASADADGSIASYNWTYISGPSSYSFCNPTIDKPAINNLVEGAYQFELTVTDDSSATAKDTVKVTVKAQQSANCGKSFKIVVLGSSTAYGTNAQPIDSSWVNKYKYYIKSVNANNEIINLGTQSRTTYHVLCPTGFVPPAGRPAPDTLKNITKALSYNPDLIIINLPSNDAGLNYTLEEQKANYERTMVLANERNIPVWVTTTQPRSTFNTQQRDSLKKFRDWTYERFGSRAVDFWTTIANADGTLNDAYNSGDGIHVNNAGYHIFYTRMVEERILEEMCSLTGGTPNATPVANAGTDVNITLPKDSVHLNGTNSTDADGSIVSYKWTKISGPANHTFKNAAASSTWVNYLSTGTYVFELSVTDNKGAIGRDSVQVTVAPAPNQKPIALAGADEALQLPKDSTTLNGSGVDNDGNITAYAWSKVSGPSGGVIASPASAITKINGLQSGLYVYELKVTDNQGAIGKDSVSITVSTAPPANKAPTANAGNDKELTLPQNSIQLDGSASVDADGTITKYSWTKFSGPAQYTIDNSAAVKPFVSNLVEGIYVFRLTVTDNANATSFDDVLVTVNAAPQTTMNRQRVLIDIGHITKTTTSPDAGGKYWNNITDAREGIRLQNAVDSANTATTIGVEVVNRIDGTSFPDNNGINYNNTIGNVGDYPASAVEDNAFAHNSATNGKWRVFGLDPSRNYTFKFWGTRSTYGSRIMQIKKQTDATWSQQFETVNNKIYDQAAYFYNITGVTEVVFDMRVLPGQVWSCFSIIDIVSTQGGNANARLSTNKNAAMQFDTKEWRTVLKDDNNIFVYPNPTNNDINLQIKNKLTGEVNIRIVDMWGRVVKEFKALKEKDNFFKTLSLQGLQPNEYLVEIIIGNNKQTKKIVKH